MLVKRILMVQWLIAHITVNLPEELYEKIKKHPEVKWAAVAREAMAKYVKMLEEAKEKEAEKKTKNTEDI